MANTPSDIKKTFESEISKIIRTDQNSTAENANNTTVSMTEKEYRAFQAFQNSRTKPCNIQPMATMTDDEYISYIERSLCERGIPELNYSADAIQRLREDRDEKVRLLAISSEALEKISKVGSKTMARLEKENEILIGKLSSVELENVRLKQELLNATKERVKTESDKNAEIAKYKQGINLLKQQLLAGGSPDVRKYQTVLKIAAAAICRNGGKAELKKRGLAGQLERWTQSLGIRVSDDQLRKYLVELAEFIEEESK
jgi:hypothetical protein